jgi:hypothetical protein
MDYTLYIDKYIIQKNDLNIVSCVILACVRDMPVYVLIIKLSSFPPLLTT